MFGNQLAEGSGHQAEEPQLTGYVLGLGFSGEGLGLWFGVLGFRFKFFRAWVKGLRFWGLGFGRVLGFGSFPKEGTTIYTPK